MNPPRCNCGLPAVLRTVSKEGQNKGRRFFGCPRFGTDEAASKCNFLLWEDAQPAVEGNNHVGFYSLPERMLPMSPPDLRGSSAPDPAIPRFYKTPSISNTQEPTPKTLPQTDLPLFGTRRIASCLAPTSPSPLVIPTGSPVEDDDYSTPVDRLPPFAVRIREPTSPRKRAREAQEEWESEVRPRRLFESQPAEAYGDSQTSSFGPNSQFSNSEGKEGNWFTEPPVNPHHPISGTESRYSTKTVLFTSRGSQTDNSSSSNNTEQKEIGELRKKVEKLERLLRARDGTIASLRTRLGSPGSSPVGSMRY